jgi:fructokinase
VALTFGAAGAELVSREARVRMPAPGGLAVVDTVGAGDCFFSGLLAWLHRAGRLERAALERLDAGALAPALRHAIASASLDLLRAGCAPPTWEEAARFAAAMAAPA